MTAGDWVAAPFIAAGWLSVTWALIVIARGKATGPLALLRERRRLCWYRIARWFRLALRLPFKHPQPAHDRVRLSFGESAMFVTLMRLHRERGTWAPEPDQERKPR